jgi:hypothetical protein
VVVDAPDWRTKAAKEERDAATAAGRLPVLAHEYAEAQRIVDAIRDQMDGFGIALKGVSEQAIVWEEASALGPVLCKGLLDHLILATGGIIDLKTTRNAHPRECARSAISYGYDLQAAAYSSALEHLRPDLAGRIDFIFLFVEMEPPYMLVPARLDDSMRELGERRWRRAIEAWARCLQDEHWPAYAEEPVLLKALGWALRQEEIEEVEDEIAW